MTRRGIWLVMACLLGGLMVAVVASGLQKPAQAATPAANPLDVVINEVAWMGTAASGSDEWIEFYNNTDFPIDIETWSIYGADTGACLDFSDADGFTTTTIPALGYLIYANHEDDVRDSGGASIVDIWDATIGMNDTSPGQVILYDASGCGGGVIDTANQATGNWFAGDSVDKETMERNNPAASGTDGANWTTNDPSIARNGLDADGGPISGTPKAQNSCYQPPAEGVADLAIVKTGPFTAAAGSVITYTIAISNTGATTATGTLVTDTLPAAVEFVTQTSHFTFSQPGGALVWEVGDVPTGTQHILTVTARVTDTALGALTNRVTATTTASETVTSNNADEWTTMVGGPTVFISAVLYDGYQAGDEDEAVQLVNIGTDPVDLAGWELCKNTTSGLNCRALPFTVLTPTARIWVARNALSFTISFGFAPDNQMDSWLVYGLSNTGDEVVLRDANDVVDTLVYEDGVTTTVGWSGPAVEPYSVGRHEGQIVARIPEETTGLPITDTDTAADWIQYTGDVIHGRRVLYPGWDLDPLFWPVTATEAATIVVGIAPDNAFDVVSQTIARAQHAISIEVYSLRHPEVVTALVQKARAGVSVTVLLEGQQASVSHADPEWQQELWACGEIERAGGKCWFMIDDGGQDIFGRYTYVHAKFIVVDGEWVLITSQNLALSGMSSDDKSNGTFGSRGMVLATDAPSVVSHTRRVFALDLDPAHHNDLLRWSADLTGTYGPPVISYTPQITVPDYTSTTAHFSRTLTVSGTFDFELFTAPEAALRQSDALLGLVARAGLSDSVHVEQMYEYVDWGDNPVDDPNLRLEAYIGAARRGATVRILLNKGSFGGPAFTNPNAPTVAYVNQIARDEGLDLEAAVADPTVYGIHNKMVLVSLQGEGDYVHVGSINGSEGSSKVNREMAIQVRSTEVYSYLKGVFDYDWRWTRPLCFPMMMRSYVPPASYPLVSEVHIAGDEWIEIYNPGPDVSIAGWTIGDAIKTKDYGDGRYRFPGTAQLAHGEVIVAAACATSFSSTYGAYPDYEWTNCSVEVPNLAPAGSWKGFGLALGNTRDEALLLNGSGSRVDVVAWGGKARASVVPFTAFTPPFSSYATLKRYPPGVDRDDCTQDFYVSYNPSPGYAAGE